MTRSSIPSNIANPHLQRTTTSWHLYNSKSIYSRVLPVDNTFIMLSCCTMQTDTSVVNVLRWHREKAYKRHIAAEVLWWAPLWEWQVNNKSYAFFENENDQPFRRPFAYASLELYIVVTLSKLHSNLISRPHFMNGKCDFICRFQDSLPSTDQVLKINLSIVWGGGTVEDGVKLQKKLE